MAVRELKHDACIVCHDFSSASKARCLSASSGCTTARLPNNILTRGS
jgi:hypothetical protein